MQQLKPIATNAIEVVSESHGQKQKIIYVQTPYPKMRNLVFKGGGTRGVGYAGVAYILEKFKFMDEVENVAGSSAGSIAAMFVALGYSADVMIRQMSEMDLGKFVGDAKVETLLDKAKKIFSILWRDNHSLSAGDELLSWLQSAVDDKLSELDKQIADFEHRPYVRIDHRNATFEDLDKYIKLAKEKNIPCKLKHLYIVVTVISTQEPESEVCSHANPLTYRLPIAKAIRASCSLPFVFKTVPLQLSEDGDPAELADGSCINTFPVGIFDDEDELQAGIGFTKKGTNPGTFGVRMDSKNERQHILYNIKKNVTLTTITDYVKQYMFALTQALNIPKLRIRNILSIDHENMPMLSLDFDKNKLIESAKKSTLDYLRDRIDAVYTAIPYNGIQDWLSHQTDTDLDYILMAYEDMLQKEKQDNVINKESSPDQIKRMVELAEHVQLLRDYKDYVCRKRRDDSVVCDIKFPEKHIDIPPTFAMSKWSELVKEDAINRYKEIPALIDNCKTICGRQRERMTQKTYVYQDELTNYVRHLETMKTLQYEAVDLRQKLAIKPQENDDRLWHDNLIQHRAFEFFARDANPIVNKYPIPSPLNIVLEDIDLNEPLLRVPVEKGKMGFDISIDMRLQQDRKLFLTAALLYMKWRNYKPSSYEKLTHLYRCQQRVDKTIPIPGSDTRFDIHSLSKSLRQTGIDLEVSVYKIENLMRRFEKREFPKYKPEFDIDDVLNIPRVEEKDFQLLSKQGFFANNDQIYILKKPVELSFFGKISAIFKQISHSIFDAPPAQTLFVEGMKMRNEFLAKLDKHAQLTSESDTENYNLMISEVLHAWDQAHKHHDYAAFIDYIKAKKMPAEWNGQDDHQPKQLFYR